MVGHDNGSQNAPQPDDEAEGGVAQAQHPPFTAAEAAARTAQMATEVEQLAQREAEAARLSDVIAQVASAVAHELALSAIVEVVLDQTTEILGARFAYVLIADESRRELKLVGHRLIPEDLVAKLTAMSFGSTAMAARAAVTKEIQTVPSRDSLAPSWLLAHESLARTGAESLVALPLLVHEHLIGVLTFGLSEPHVFGDEELRSLQICAEIFAFGIWHAAAYENERRLRALFDSFGQTTQALVGLLEITPMLQTVVDEARRTSDAEYAALGIATSPDRPFDPWLVSARDASQAARITNPPQPTGIFGEIAVAGRTVHLSELVPGGTELPDGYPAISSLLGVPVRHDGAPVGTLYLLNKVTGGDFTAKDVHAMERLAERTAQSVRQASLRNELVEERARFQAIVEHAPYGVIFTEAGTETVIANPRAYELAGQTDVTNVNSFRGQLLTPEGDVIPPDEWPARQALKGNPFRTQELIVRRPDGSEAPLLISSIPIFRPSGELEGSVSVFEDITQLKEQQRLREEWASIVAHDLRQPLNIIIASVSMLQHLAETPNSQGLHRALGHTQRAAKTLNRMVSDLADATLLEARRLQLEIAPCDVEELVRGVVERQQTLAPERTVVIDFADPLPQIELDSLRIEQVFSNLLVNALKYSFAETPIEIAVRIVNNELHVAVTNHGPGVPAEELPNLFSRYFRARAARAGKARGLGLGLYIAKGLIEAHGGRIWAESRPGDTTTFTFAIPAVRHETVH